MLQKYDPRNENIKVHIGGRLYDRADAKISVLDSTVQGGDAVWEGLRVYKGKIFCLDKHLNRMMSSAKAMAFQNVPSKIKITEAIWETLEANGMRDETHIRLTLSRGLKTTSGMDPRLNIHGCTLIVLAEWKAPVYGKEGLKLITSSIRRNSPQTLDSKIHHNNLINNILAKIEANLAGVGEAIMLDVHGFVSEANATNIFMIKDGTVHTPHPDACLPGITRQTVIDICIDNAIPIRERNISMTEFYAADEVFTTGTMGELTWVSEIDGRLIENLHSESVLDKIQVHYKTLTETEGNPLPF